MDGLGDTLTRGRSGWWWPVATRWARAVIWIQGLRLGYACWDLLWHSSWCWVWSSHPPLERYWPNCQPREYYDVFVMILTLFFFVSLLMTAVKLWLDFHVVFLELRSLSTWNDLLDFGSGLLYFAFASSYDMWNNLSMVSAYKIKTKLLLHKVILWLLVIIYCSALNTWGIASPSGP